MGTASLTTISKSNLLALMISEKLFTKAAIGRYFNLSRERVRKILEAHDVDFDELKNKAVKTVYEEDVSLDGEVWKKITHINVAYDYLVSNKGRVARDIKRKVSGCEYTERKICTPSTYKNKHFKVSLVLHSEKQNINYSDVHYVHVLVANAFKSESKPKDKKHPRIKFLDDNIHNTNADNLEWIIS